jgi:hypothetical protein
MQPQVQQLQLTFELGLAALDCRPNEAGPYETQPPLWKHAADVSFAAASDWPPAQLLLVPC